MIQLLFLLASSLLEPSHQVVRQPKLLQGEPTRRETNSQHQLASYVSYPGSGSGPSEAAQADTAQHGAGMCLPCQALPKLQIQVGSK